MKLEALKKIYWLFFPFTVYFKRNVATKKFTLVYFNCRCIFITITIRTQKFIWYRSDLLQARPKVS